MGTTLLHYTTHFYITQHTFMLHNTHHTCTLHITHNSFTLHIKSCSFTLHITLHRLELCGTLSGKSPFTLIFHINRSTLCIVHVVHIMQILVKCLGQCAQLRVHCAFCTFYHKCCTVHAS